MIGLYLAIACASSTGILSQMVNNYPVYLYPSVNKRSFDIEEFHPNDVANERIKRELNSQTYLKCAITTDTEPDPWWRVQLPEEAIVTRVIIDNRAINNNGHTRDMQNLDIRVGNDDIKRKNPKYFYNYVCFHSPVAVLLGKHSYICEPALVGKFISIHVNNSCNSIGCNPGANTFLSLCEVEVMGYYLNSVKRQEIRASNRVRLTSQSSVGFNGVASLAVDGNTNTEFERVERKHLCARVIDETNYKHQMKFELDVSELFEIKEIRFPMAGSAISGDQTYDVTTYVQYESTNITSTKGKQYTRCPNLEGAMRLTNVIKCDPSTFGKSVIIVLTKRCKRRPHVCDLEVLRKAVDSCRIEVYGYPIKNVAEGQQTLQSSTSHHAISDLAVDKNTTMDFYADDTIQRPFCTHTSDDKTDAYPWWRVDLTVEHVVDKLLIYNRKNNHEGRLHDIQIRVGNEDIKKVQKNKLFEGNLICKSILDQFLNFGGNEVTCDHPLMGTYVSIQIIKPCKAYRCEPPMGNILTLCEVEVFGFPTDKYYHGNAALGKPFKSWTKESERVSLVQAKPISAIASNPATEHLYWWQMDLTDVHVVSKLELGFDFSNSRNIDHHFKLEIIVGFSDFTVVNRNAQPFTSSLACLEAKPFDLKEELIIQCKQQVIGRYVTIFSTNNCPSSYCNPNVLEALKLTSMEVWASKIRKNSGVNGITDMASIDWTRGHAIISTTNYERLENVIRTAQCTQTAADELYPWWEIDLKAVAVVKSVTIFNRGEASFNRRLHDLEIRVGHNNIGTVRTTTPFRKNDLCAETPQQSLPKGSTTLTCSQPLLGQFVTIQIVRLCDSDACDRFPFNILSLCEVYINGYEINQSQQAINLSLNRPAAQSTTWKSKTANLAVDGVIQ